MKKKTILIVGGGVAGLSAGIYAEQNGFHAVIYEKNPVIGGLCTGWYRKGSYIDGCIHWLTGTKKGEILNGMWENCNAINENSVIYLNSFGTVIYEKTKVIFYTDFDKAEKEWIKISPEDKRVIKKFFRYARNIAYLELPLHCPISLMPFKLFLKVGIKMVPHLSTLLFTSKTTPEKFAKKFKSPALRFALENVFPGRNNLFSFLYAYATLANRNGGIPVGGSKPLTDRMAQRFLDLGGEIKFNSPIKSIYIENHKAKGVILKNDEVINGDYVVAACDAIYTLAQLLDNKYVDKDYRDMLLDDKKYPIPSCVEVILKVKDDMYGIGVPTTFKIKPLKVGNSVIETLNFRPFNYDLKTYKDDNGVLASVLIDQFEFDFPFWKNLRKDSYEKYKLEKERIGNEIIERIINQYPYLKEKVYLLDVFTPLTLNRYVNAYSGAYMPFSFTSKGKMLFHNGMVSDLDNFYLATQWTQTPGGLPLALCSGKFVIQRILKKEKKWYMVDLKKKKVKNT